MSEVKDIYKHLSKDYIKRKDFRHLVFFKTVNMADIPFRLYSDVLPHYKERALFTKLVYMYFREIDDIVDGDKHLSPDLDDFEKEKVLVRDYLYRRMNFFFEEGAPYDDLDIIMDKLFSLSAEIGIDVRDDILKLLQSIEFDLNRRCDIKNGSFILSNREEIEKYYFDYYMACHRIGVMMTATHPSDNLYDDKNLKMLGYARRKYFILRDFLDDLNDGIINIPSDQMGNINEKMLFDLVSSFENDPDYISLSKKKGYNFRNVSNILTPEIKSWLDTTLDESLDFLHTYQKGAPLRGYGDIAREVLFDRNDLSDVVVRVMLEDSTNDYLNMLDRNKTLNLRMQNGGNYGCN